MDIAPCLSEKRYEIGRPKRGTGVVFDSVRKSFRTFTVMGTRHSISLIWKYPKAKFRATVRDRAIYLPSFSPFARVRRYLSNFTTGSFSNIRRRVLVLRLY